MSGKPIVPALPVALTLFVACAPHFQPRYESNFSCLAHPESEPIIAVARGEPGAVSFAGRPFTDHSIPAGPIRMFKVRVSIENVLKGDAPTGDVDIFYFAPVTAATGGLAFSVTKTFRDMLLLRREDGRLRMAEDITSDCEAGMHSGTHPNFKPGRGETLREEMIDLLLTPGVGATDLGTIRAIFERAPPVISPEYTAKALLSLAASQRPAVRTAACLQLRDVMSDLLGKSPERALTLGGQLGVPKFELERLAQAARPKRMGKELVGRRAPDSYATFNLPPA